MQLRATLLVVLWIAWVLIWIGAAIHYRPDARDRGQARPRRRVRYLWARLLVAAFVILAVRTHHLGSASFGHGIGWVGVGLCVVGLGIATWARVCLGRSWGMPMTVRAKPVLVRSGPYRVVRHPIYSGLLLALIGSGLANGPGWLVAILAGGAYFVLCVRVEDRDMAALFPDEYPEYASHTKRLVPFVY